MRVATGGWMAAHARTIIPAAIVSDSEALGQQGISAL